MVLALNFHLNTFIAYFIADDTAAPTKVPSSDLMSQILHANAFLAMKPFLVGKKPKERRHVLAAFSQNMKKAEVEQVLEENISQREWHTAKKTCLLSRTYGAR